MRKLLPLAALAASLVATPAQAEIWSVYGINGNDTGGIIPWSPGIEPLMFSVASEHCARYAKTAHITSVHRVYGDYIGFRCRRGPLMPEPVVVPPWVLWPWYKP
jgi:hypothetical protein